MNQNYQNEHFFEGLNIFIQHADYRDLENFRESFELLWANTIEKTRKFNYPNNWPFETVLVDFLELIDSQIEHEKFMNAAEKEFFENCK